MKLPIIKNGLTIAQLPIPDGAMLNRGLMGAKEVRIDIELPGTLLSPIGSHITRNGEQYTINTPPLSVTKVNNYRYQYSLMFESSLYKMYDKGFKHLGNRTFQYYSNPAGYAQLIADCMNTIDPGWTVGMCDDLPEMAITFSGQTCRNALDVTAEAFGIEWSVVGKDISFVRQVGNVTTLVFEYGRGKGLYELSYQYQNDKNIVTRATGYGSSRNLPEGYRDGATQLMFEGEYLDKNIYLSDGITPLYGIKEGDYVNEAIYPEANGLVSAVSYTDGQAIFTISAATLDFDLNTYFGPLDPKLSFKTGELQGQEFKIRKYEHGTRTITLDVFTDGNGNNLPNATFQPAIGDIFDLFDMYLPTEIVQDAEDRLQAATQEWLNENSVPRVKYNLDIDPLFMRDNGIELNEGDKVRVIDTSLGVDEMIRIVKITQPFVFPDYIPPNTKITCEIANFIPYTITERVIANTIDNKNQIITVDRTASERSRLSSLEFRKLAQRMFDPDGNLAKGAESLFAAFIQVGFDSQNFELVDTIISTNTANDPNVLSISAGKLVHNVYSVEGLGYEWVFPAQAWTGLDPLKFYYVYAKASKTSLSATWEISETPVFVNDIPGFWAFNLGQLYEVNTDGYRSFKFTKGITNIVGNMIDTGTIDADLVNVINLVATNVVTGILSSIDGVTQFNLDTGVIKGRIVFGSTGTSTIIDNNLVTTSTIVLGNGIVNNAGISGVGVSATDVRMWAGADFAGRVAAPFRVQQDGKMFASNAEIAGKITASEGAIGGLVIEEDNIHSTNDLFSVDDAGKLTAQDADIIGKIVADEGSIGGIEILANSIKSSNDLFSVTDAGLLTAQNADITGKITADEGTIGGIEIAANSIHSANDKFRVDNAGALHAESGDIGGIILEANSIHSANNKFIVDDAGNMTAEAGTIGGNTITATGISGAKFSIENGVLEAEDATITGTFKTANTGKRVEVSGLENNIRLIDSDGNVIVDVDDDSALLSTTFELPEPGLIPRPKNFLRIKAGSGGTIGIYADLGPGISVGKSWTDTAGFSSISTEEIATTGKLKSGSSVFAEEEIITTKTVGGVKTTYNAQTEKVRFTQGGVDYYMEFVNGVYVGKGPWFD